MAFHARTHLDTMLALRTDCIAVNVRQMMSRLLPQGNCSIEAVARQLGVDRRTVHRKRSTNNASCGRIRGRLNSGCLEIPRQQGLVVVSGLRERQRL
ncbi:hypothetical protein VSR17_30695, partial [Cupriavidus taiwanensis]